MYTRLILVIPTSRRPDTSPISYLLRSAKENPKGVPPLEWEGSTIKIACDIQLGEGVEDLQEVLRYLQPYTKPTNDLIGFYRREDTEQPTLIWFRDGQFIF